MIIAGPHRAPFLTCLIVAALFVVAPDQSSALDLADVQELVDESRLTFARFEEHPDMEWFRRYAKEAQAIVIVPDMVRLGYLLGAAYGKAIVLVRDEQTGQWSDPAFLTLVSAGVGLQIGIAQAEVVALAMTKRSAESFVHSRLFLGTGITLAAGPVGRAVSGSTTPTLSADVISFARVKGAFAGVKLSGTLVFSNDQAHALYYGGPFRSQDILEHPGRVRHWYSDRLQAMLNRVSKDEP